MTVCSDTTLYRIRVVDVRTGVKLLAGHRVLLIRAKERCEFTGFQVDRMARKNQIVARVTHFLEFLRRP